MAAQSPKIYKFLIKAMVEKARYASRLTYHGYRYEPFIFKWARKFLPVFYRNNYKENQDYAQAVYQAVAIKKNDRELIYYLENGASIHEPDEVIREFKHHTLAEETRKEFEENRKRGEQEKKEPARIATQSVTGGPVLKDGEKLSDYISEPQPLPGQQLIAHVGEHHPKPIELVKGPDDVWSMPKLPSRIPAVIVPQKIEESLRPKSGRRFEFRLPESVKSKLKDAGSFGLRNTRKLIYRYPRFFTSLFTGAAAAVLTFAATGSPATASAMFIAGAAAPEIIRRRDDSDNQRGYSPSDAIQNQYIQRYLMRRFGPNIGSKLGGKAASTGGRLASRGATMAARAAIPLLANPWTWVVIGIIIIIILLFFFIKSLDTMPRPDEDPTTGVPKIEELVELKKTGPAEVPNKTPIQYTITLKNKTDFPQAIVVLDPIPQDSEYVTSSPAATREGETLVWYYDNLAPKATETISLTLKPTKDDFYLVNKVGSRRKGSPAPLFPGGLPGASTSPAPAPGSSGGIFVGSANLEEIFVAAAKNAGIPLAFLKAIANTEAGRIFSYSEAEIIRFSTPSWWNGLTDNAARLEDNHSDIRRGYAYNTCQYARNSAGVLLCPANDVRGPMQFEIKTWGGIKGRLSFPDGHEPDRRNLVDAIFGGALYNKDNAVYFGDTSIDNWSEATVKAVARMYCAGPAAGRDPSRANHGACMAGGKRYDDIVWDLYRQYVRN